MSSNEIFKKVEKLYDDRIESTNNSIKATGGWGTENEVSLICEEIFNKIGIQKNDRVLELGCGSGVLGNWIKKRCDYYVGADISYKMVDFFLKSDHENKTNLLQGTTNKVPFANEIFDIIILNGVTMYFPDDKTLEETLEEMKRVLKSNGAIFIGENISSSGYPWELTWFQDLSPSLQILARPYIKIRRWLAEKNSKLAGKWKYIYREISPDLISKCFANIAKIEQSRAATFTIRTRLLGKKYNGSRRVDFLINLQQ